LASPRDWARRRYLPGCPHDCDYSCGITSVHRGRAYHTWSCGVKILGPEIREVASLNGTCPVRGLLPSRIPDRNLTIRDADGTLPRQPGPDPPPAQNLLSLLRVRGLALQVALYHQARLTASLVSNETTRWRKSSFRRAILKSSSEVDPRYPQSVRASQTVAATSACCHQHGPGDAELFPKLQHARPPFDSALAAAHL